MKLTKHILLGSVIGIILYPIYKLQIIWFVAASVLIDVDHYGAFLIKNRFVNYNIKTMFRYYDTLIKWKSRKELLGINMFHTFEFMLVLGIFAYYFNSLIINMVWMGFLFHNICDFIYLYRLGIPDKRSYYYLEYFRRKNIFLKQGIDINNLHQEAIKFVETEH